jgi:hypothetical protein
LDASSALEDVRVPLPACIVNRKPPIVHEKSRRRANRRERENSDATAAAHARNFRLTPAQHRRKTNRARMGNENFPSRAKKYPGEKFRSEVRQGMRAITGTHHRLA